MNPKAIDDFITQFGQAYLNKYIGFERKKLRMRKVANYGQEQKMVKREKNSFYYLFL